MKLKKKNFVVLYCEDWNTPLKTSKHHFIERLAFENNKILYIEVPLNPFNFFLNSKNLFKKTYLKGRKSKKKYMDFKTDRSSSISSIFRKNYR